mmetsp:Transcript_26433/g.31189  ORF Transcript_26433/g.31189 Transcript_26433/m.31189 type:complete len:98 (-) Transcript_26433:305-598(-)
MINNTFRQLARSAIPNQRRLMSSNGQYSTTFITAGKDYSMKKTWLSDPATYPLIAVLGIATGLCSGFGFWFLLNNPDVRLNPQKRNTLIRTWGGASN